MNCPHDASELQKQNYEGTVEVDACPTCRGVFLDVGELREIQELDERDYTERLRQMPNLVGRAHAAALARSRPPVDCPRCAVAMERREHGYTSQILVDVCPECRGVWLDRGELEALEVFFERTQEQVAEDKPPHPEVAEGTGGRQWARLRYFMTLRDKLGGAT